MHSSGENSLNDRFVHGIQNIDTLRKLVDSLDERYDDLTALSTYNGKDYRTMSYKDMKSRIRNLGGYLLSVCKRGEIIGIMSENRLEWPVVYLAAASVGVIIVPLDIFFTKSDLVKVMGFLGFTKVFVSNKFSELITEAVIERKIPTELFLLDDLGSSGVVARSALYGDLCRWFSYHELEVNDAHVSLYDAEQIQPSDSASLIYMTGDSYAELTHGSLTANVYGMLEQVHDGGRYYLPGERSVITVAFHHSWPTVGGFLMPLASYGEVLMLPKYIPDVFLKSFTEYQGAYAITVPLLLERKLNYIKQQGANLASLKFMVVGGAPTHISLIEGMRAMRCEVLQMYGLSECSPTITVTSPSDNPPGSIGQIIHGLEYRIRQTHADGVGELLVRGTSLMKGYFRQQEETKKMIKDGWLHTGDLVKKDCEGNFYVVGRCRDLVVNKGGKNIYPSELEAIIRKNKYIEDVKVVARIDDEIGEYPFARVQLDELALAEADMGYQFCEETLVQFLLNQIKLSMSNTGVYKTPRGVEIIPSGQPLTEGEYFYFGDYYMEPLKLTEADSNDLETGDVPEAPPGSGYVLVDLYFLSHVVNCTKYDINSIDRNSKFEDIGVDSLVILSIRHAIEKQLGHEIPLHLLGECACIADLTNAVLLDPNNQEFKYKIVEFSMGLEGNGELEPELKHLLCDVVLHEANIADMDTAQLDDVYGELISIGQTL